MMLDIFQARVLAVYKYTSTISYETPVPRTLFIFSGIRISLPMSLVSLRYLTQPVHQVFAFLYTNSSNYAFLEILEIPTNRACRT